MKALAFVALLSILPAAARADSPTSASVDAATFEYDRLLQRARAATGRDLVTAIDNYRKAFEFAEQHFGGDSGKTMVALGDLAEALSAAGRYVEAEPLLHRFYDALLSKNGATVDSLVVEEEWADALYKLGDIKGNSQRRHDLWLQYTALWGPNDMETLRALQNYADRGHHRIPCVFPASRSKIRCPSAQGISA